MSWFALFILSPFRFAPRPNGKAAAAPREECIQTYQTVSALKPDCMAAKKSSRVPWIEGLIANLMRKTPMIASYTAKSTLFTTATLMAGALLVALANMQAAVTMLTGF